MTTIPLSCIFRAMVTLVALPSIMHRSRDRVAKSLRSNSARKGACKLPINRQCYRPERMVKARGARKAFLPPAQVLIVMRDFISDLAATAFAAKFYAAIASGQSVKSSFEQGKVAVEAVSINEADTPTLITANGVNQQSIVRPSRHLPPSLRHIASAACNAPARRYLAR